MALPADTARVSAAEVPVADSIRLYAELVCDSASYLVMENRGSRPVTTDAGYRFVGKAFPYAAGIPGGSCSEPESGIRSG